MIMSNFTVTIEIVAIFSRVAMVLPTTADILVGIRPEPICF